MMMMMMKGLMVDENLSILTCESGEISSSSGIRNEPTDPLYSHQSSASTKKKRNLPGNPDPEAEVISLSPKTLVATNRFVCEICKKGFQRDQNLQLHRRGHNLPWKLKQRSNKEVKKKVYVCPETTCVHNHPSRALGDLTGIKKHFFRKHGEKKWKCEKCSKRYAVQSDWKAHSKICGTKEYRCDCGTLFSRRDSFITHRAFCDALAHESTAVTSSAMEATNPPLHSFPIPLKLEQQDHNHFFTLTSSQSQSQLPSNWFHPQPPSLSCNNNIPPQPPPAPLINPDVGVVSSISTTIDDDYNAQSQSVIIQNHQQNPNPTSASSLLTTTTLQPQNNTSIPLMFGSFPGWELAVLNNNSSFNGLTPNLDDNKAETAPLFHDMMSFEEALNGILMNRINKENNAGDGVGGDGDMGETRDFLGLRGLDRTDDHMFNMNEINDMNSSSSTYEIGPHQNQATFWLN